jgi:membrane fusion protein (multidrug efflux system)
MAGDIPVPLWKSWWVRAVALVVLIAVAGAAWFLASDRAKTAQPVAAVPVPAPGVGVRLATMKGVSQAFEFVGRIKATEKVELRARVEGFLQRVYFREGEFREGQDVKKGDLLYQIEKVQYQAQVDQAKANLVAAEAELTNAKLQYNRQLELSKRQYSPQSQVDELKAQVDTATGKVMQAQAALTQAQTNLDYTDIHAPIDGRIGRTAYTVGNLVNPASGVLATIVSQDPMYVVFPVSVRDLETIREARRREGEGGTENSKIDIHLRLSNGKDYPHVGRWNFTDPQVDQQTDSLIMRATIPNPERALSDGQFVTAIIQERREEPRLVIPQMALQVDQSGYYVLVVNDKNQVEQRRVQTGPNRGTDVVVSSGVRDGEKVIVDGIQKVRPGQVVQATVLPPTAGG